MVSRGSQGVFFYFFSVAFFLFFFFFYWFPLCWSERRGGRPFVGTVPGVVVRPLEESQMNDGLTSWALAKAPVNFSRHSSASRDGIRVARNYWTCHPTKRVLGPRQGS